MGFVSNYSLSNKHNIIKKRALQKNGTYSLSRHSCQIYYLCPRFAYTRPHILNQSAYFSRRPSHIASSRAHKMAEEEILIRPAPPASNAPKYYYPPQLYYVPEPYHTTVLPKHHYHEPSHAPSALDSVRHAVGHAFHAIEKEIAHPYGDYPLPTPNTDIRESKSHYYIDVELPGAHDKRDIVLKWTGLNTLYLDATIKRQPTPEEKLEPGTDAAAQAQESTLPTSPERKSEDNNNNNAHNKEGSDGHSKKKKGKAEKPVHLVKHERRVGRYARAFAFPVPVDQEKITAKLAYGILSITLPKKEVEKSVDHRHVHIEHEGH
jgi:HSP20 family molecular chaperone IbpA